MTLVIENKDLLLDHELLTYIAENDCFQDTLLNFAKVMRSANNKSLVGDLRDLVSKLHDYVFLLQEFQNMDPEKLPSM